MKLKDALKYLDLSKSSYLYKANARDKPKREYILDPSLKEALLGLTGYELTLGYTKLTTYLRGKFYVVWNKKKVYAHMKTLKLLQPKHIKRRYTKNRRLIACCPIRSNVRWEADMTYVPTQMGNMYLFVIEDVYDKEILAGHMDIRCGAAEAIEALKEAIKRRFEYGIPDGLVLTVRIDRGCQFTAEDFITFAKTKGIVPEFCGVQTPNDKPYIESFIGCYKNDEVYRNTYEDFFQACEGWKNYRNWYDQLRPHGSLGNMTPKAFRELKSSPILV